MDVVARIEREAARLADVLGPLDPATPVPTCPGWTAEDLLWHLTEVHEFWAAVLRTGALTDADVAAAKDTTHGRPTGGDARERLDALRAAATADLAAQLRAVSDDAPRWSWHEPDRTAGFTRRMQTHEATMHRIDAELTAGVPVSFVPAELAAAGVGHGIEVMWSWQPPAAVYRRLGVVELVASDIADRWTVEAGRWAGTDEETGGRIERPKGRRAAPGREAEAVVTAPAVELYRYVWGRPAQVERAGDPAALAALAAVVGAGV